jgi:hypothetical protein
MTAPTDRAMNPRHLQLGDMLVVGNFPAKMIKALAVIADRLHPAYDALPDRKKDGNSKESCLFSSLVVRDFLVGIGYKDATVKPCTLVMRADRNGAEVHSLGIGIPGDRDNPEKYNGHAAVVVPSVDILIDVTLYQAIREQWQGAISGMMALGYEPHSDRRLRELKQIAGMGFTAVADDLAFQIAWGDRPDINWRRQPDMTDPHSLRRRRQIAKLLQEAFGNFRDAV